MCIRDRIKEANGTLSLTMVGKKIAENVYERILQVMAQMGGGRDVYKRQL